MTTGHHGQIIDSIPKSLTASFIFSGTVGSIVQVGTICLLHTSIFSAGTDLFRHFLQLELPNASTNHIWQSFAGL
jgi:hypothetical protein